MAYEHGEGGKKKRRRVMSKARIEAISAVDRPAQEPATVAIMKRADEPITKLKPRDGESQDDFVSRFMSDGAMKHEYPDEKQRAAVAHSMHARQMRKKWPVEQPRLLSDVNGHSHFIDLADGPGGETSATKSEGAEYSHSHPWVRLDDGAILIGAAEGHTHELRLEKAEFSAEQRRQLAESGVAMPDGAFPIRNAEDLRNAIGAFGRAKNKAAVARHIKRRAAALKLTDLLPEDGALADLLSKGLDASATDGDTMTPEEKAAIEQAKKDLEQMTKRAERAEQVAQLTDAQRAIMPTDEKARDEFLALAPEAREALVRKAQKDAADENAVVETIDGMAFRKNDDPRLLAMAKQARKDREERAAAQKQLREEQLRKRAKEELSHLPGDEATKVALLDAVEAMPQATRESIAKILQAHDGGLSESFRTAGVRGEPAGGNDPEAELEKLAKAAREKNPKLTPEQAYAQALNTPEGRELYEARA